MIQKLQKKGILSIVPLAVLGLIILVVSLIVVPKTTATYNEFENHECEENCVETKLVCPDGYKENQFDHSPKDCNKGPLWDLKFAYFVEVCVEVELSCPTPSPSATPEATPSASPSPTATPFQHQACGRPCGGDSDCQALDKSYRCTPEHICRLIEAPENPECKPREKGPEPTPGVISNEDLKKLPSGVK